MGSNLTAVDLGPGLMPVQVAAGRRHACAVMQPGGLVKCWGWVLALISCSAHAACTCHTCSLLTHDVLLRGLHYGTVRGHAYVLLCTACTRSLLPGRR